MLQDQNKIIDFHMHAFPDKIALRTMEHLSGIAGSQPVTDGTIAGTLKNMASGGITSGVIMQIATKPSQQTTINNWAAQVQQDTPGLVFFGSVHPDAPDAVQELSRIRDLGLCGVKLHPDYQGFFVDDPRMFPIYEAIQELGLPVLFHTGRDPVSPGVIHAPAQKLAQVLELFPDMTVIAAHMGGLGCYDDTERYLVGKNLYLDTSMPGALCSQEQAVRIIKNHGADRILFATDCPWSDAAQSVQFLQSLGLNQEELELIFHKNAEELLKTR